MIVKIRKSGNSVSLRIPPETLREMNLSIGEELIMKTDKNTISFEKKTNPREGWFDDVSPLVAQIEADTMNADFSHLNSFDDLDEWEHGEEW